MISEAYLMDCLQYMATVPDKWFDLAVVDPPYGICMNANMGLRKGGKKRHKAVKWDSAIPTADYFTELFRVSRNQIIWGGNYFPLPPTKHFIFWDKKNPEGMSFSDGEMGWTSYDRAIRKFTHGAVTNDKIHPTAKPIKLYSWIYANYLPQGGKVFDSHAGSNNNRIAADMAGNIDYYSTEIDPDYFNDAEKRWREYKAQAVLTFPERIDPVQSALF